MSGTERAVRPHRRLFRSDRVTVGLCFLAALADGIDIQSFGLAASDVRRAFGMSGEQIGVLASASIVGLVAGALFGGRLADRHGAKRMLVVSVAGFGLFSIGTALAPGFAVMLALRLVSGLALGGAMPNLIGLATEAGPPQSRVWRVSLTLSGAPLGGVVAGAFGATPLAAHWQSIFLVGGIVPILLAPALALGVEDRAAAAAPAGRRHVFGPSYRDVLFGGGRAAPTLSLWVAAFFTQLILFFLVNWLPLFLRQDGFGRSEAALSIVLLNLGGAVGGVILGRLMGLSRRWLVLMLTYSGVVGSLVLLGHSAWGLAAVYVGAASSGVWIIGGQVLLFGLAGELYELPMRGTGVGTTTAVARMGSTAGPLIGGMMLGGGLTAGAAISSLSPLACIAGLGAILVACRPDPGGAATPDG